MTPNSDFKVVCHYLTLDISETVRHKDIMTVEYYYELAVLKGVISNDLE